jgi:hypothetical protein
MKYFVVFFLFVLYNKFQAQIPNNGFENWTNMGTYSNPDGWGNNNNTTALAGVFTVTKGTPGNPGTGYLKLTSKTIGISLVNGIAVSGVFDSITQSAKSGFPFNQRPAQFTGKWQHMIYGSSQGSITVLLTRWDVTTGSRINVGIATHTLVGMAMSWANFIIPINYNDGSNPDTCIITLKASGNNPTNNDYLWVDDLAFTGTVVGIDDDNTLGKNLILYPNPTKEEIHFTLIQSQHISFELIEISGKIVLTENYGLARENEPINIPLTNIKAGNYILRIIGEKETVIRKIIIE